MSVNEPPRPAATYARATLEYDEHDRALLSAITKAIFTASKLSVCNAVVIRTGEAAEALLTAGRHPCDVAIGNTLAACTPPDNRRVWQTTQ